MFRPDGYLAEALNQRLKASGVRVQRCVSEACEVIVFGSMSTGLERSDSDIDVLCVGGRDYHKVKTDLLDLIFVPSKELGHRSWLQSELATHIGEYGTWIKGTPLWEMTSVSVGMQLIRSDVESRRS
jgi:predicted nucleotidyltransferase